MNASSKGLRGRWTSPKRTGMRLLISPWEYRHLRTGARVHILGGFALAGIAIVTLSFGGTDLKTLEWALAFLAMGVANWVFAYWELRIARSEASRSESGVGAGP